MNFTFSQNSEMRLEQCREGKCLLIVDDEAVIRDLCSRALKDYRILQASDGEEALNIYRKGGVDIVLTDVMMPKMDGIELLRNIKQLEPTSVVLIMTGFADRGIILNALKDDADDFITKPLNLLQLKTSVQKAVDRKVLKDEIASLKNIDRLKSEFISMVSHKFRTPLTAISLFLQNVDAGIYDPQNRDDRDHVKLIYQESCYLEKLVSELLEFGRIMDTGSTLKLVPVKLVPVLRETALQVQMAYPDHTGKLCFDSDDNFSVEVDVEKVVFAFRQIVDNAFKFSSGADVSVRVKKSDENLEISVSDDGYGIPQSELPKIFEKFYQVDIYKTGQVKGFGLGLTYSKEFIRLHGGSINIYSEEGKGTHVTILLPLKTGVIT